MKALSARACQFQLLCFLFMLLMSQSSLAQFQGKIFTSPEERAHLDALRDDFLKKSQDKGFDFEEAAPPPLPETTEEQAADSTPIEYALGGILTRRDGSHTVWLNNEPVAEANLPANMRLAVDGPLVVLRIAVGTSRFQLKPGQTLNASTGEIQETRQRVPAPADNVNVLGTTSYAETAISSDEPVPDSNTDATLPESPATRTSAEGDSSEAP
jgi:hypothetical protein